jgi:hypothetical protein
MTPAELVADLNSKGISLVANGDKLKCKGKESALTPELLETLRVHKAELMAFLSRTACTCPWPNGAAGCGPGYPVCSACVYAWCCKGCGGCRQCASPGRKVRTVDVGDGQLPPLDRPPAMRRSCGG